mgnify:CR=1 FL=1
MNSAIRPIFNESFVEKRDLWISCTVHETHCQTLDAAGKKKKKKKKKKNSAISKRSHNAATNLL